MSPLTDLSHDLARVPWSIMLPWLLVAFAIGGTIFYAVGRRSERMAAARRTAAVIRAKQELGGSAKADIDTAVASAIARLRSEAEK